MNRIILSMGILLSSASVFANNGSLDGKSYCRAILSNGRLFAMPAGENNHCISFSAGVAADSFFRNPTEYLAYEVSGQRITFGASGYDISADGAYLTAIEGAAGVGAVMILQR